MPATTLGPANHPTRQRAPGAIRATHVLAIASPSPDLLQFGREALWAAQERDLPLTLAVRVVPHLTAELLGLSTIDDLAFFAERWNITLVPWQTRSDLESMIGGWAVHPRAAVILGSRRRNVLLHGLPGPVAERVAQAAEALGVDLISDPSHESGPSPRLGLPWRVEEQRAWYHAYILSAFAVTLVCMLVRLLDGLVAADHLVTEPGVGYRLQTG